MRLSCHSLPHPPTQQCHFKTRIQEKPSCGNTSFGTPLSLCRVMSHQAVADHRFSQLTVESWVVPPSHRLQRTLINANDTRVRHRFNFYTTSTSNFSHLALTHIKGKHRGDRSYMLFPDRADAAKLCAA